MRQRFDWDADVNEWPLDRYGWATLTPALLRYLKSDGRLRLTVPPGMQSVEVDWSSNETEAQSNG